MTASTEPYDRAPRRGPLDGGRLLAGLGALALLASLFIDWYGPPEGQFGGEAGGERGISAWTSFELIDILLAALALATIVWAVDALIRRAEGEILPPRFGTIAGPVALALVVVSMISEPGYLAAFDAELREGAWIALAASALMSIGALLAFARVSLVVAPRDREPAATRGARPTSETRPLGDEPPRREPPGL